MGIALRIIATSTLKAFYLRQRAAEQPIKTWVSVTKAAKWKTPLDVKSSFPATDIRPQGRVVFDIAGNRFRIVAKIEYRLGILFIRFVGTHADYNQVNVDTV